MHDQLRSLPCERRPQSIAVFPQGWAYLRSWRTFRWFLLLLAPVVASVVAIVVRDRPWWGAGLLGLLGLAVASALFVTLQSGMSSSNWGTYFRTREPGRYWLDVAILGAAYLGIALAGYFW
ncbi:MAG: hypothetical protein JNM56_01965 [Planctomycetia bacterium]|nr:hypothetical protein [Planctomycetia bacterium]